MTKQEAPAPVPEITPRKLPSRGVYMDFKPKKRKKPQAPVVQRRSIRVNELDKSALVGKTVADVTNKGAVEAVAEAADKVATKTITEVANKRGAAEKPPLTKAATTKAPVIDREELMEAISSDEGGEAVGIRIESSGRFESGALDEERFEDDALDEGELGGDEFDDDGFVKNVLSDDKFDEGGFDDNKFDKVEFVNGEFDSGKFDDLLDDDDLILGKRNGEVPEESQTDFIFEKKTPEEYAAALAEVATDSVEKSPFIASVSVDKRPLSSRRIVSSDVDNSDFGGVPTVIREEDFHGPTHNVYTRRRETSTPDEKKREARRKSAKKSKVKVSAMGRKQSSGMFALAVAIILMIILGGIVGAFIYLLFFQH